MLRHEERLAGVDERLAGVIRHLGMMTDVEVVCGLRTQEQQDRLFEAGKTKVRHSKHQDGLAVDLGVLNPDGTINWSILKYPPMLRLLAVCARQLGVAIRFGHTWTTNPDDPPARFDDAGHVELA